MVRGHTAGYAGVHIKASRKSGSGCCPAQTRMRRPARPVTTQGRLRYGRDLAGRPKHCLCHDSHPAKGFSERAAEQWSFAPATTAWGLIPGHPAIGSWDWPWGPCPRPERSQSAAAPLRGLATHWRRLRYWRKHLRQRQAGGGAAVVSRGVARSRTLGRRPAPEIKMQCAKRPARARRLSTKF